VSKLAKMANEHPYRFAALVWGITMVFFFVIVTT
jgi:hypothetical protein